MARVYGLMRGPVVMALAAAFWLPTLLARGDEAPAGGASSEVPEGAATGQVATGAKPLTMKQERQTLEFVRAHHPELADLLEKLKASNPREYEKALADLRPAMQRLIRLEEREPAQFPHELALWKVESRIRLLIAQMVMADDESLEASLKPLLAERRELKQQSLEYERRRVAERLANLDRQLEQLQEPVETYTAHELKRLRQSIDKQRKPAKARAKAMRQKARAAQQEAPQKSETLKSKSDQGK